MGVPKQWRGGVGEDRVSGENRFGFYSYDLVLNTNSIDKVDLV
jgi:hypothetical protein